MKQRAWGWCDVERIGQPEEETPLEEEKVLVVRIVTRLMAEGGMGVCLLGLYT